MTDPVARSDQLDQRVDEMIAIPRRAVFRRSTIAIGFFVIMATLVAILGRLDRVTSDTNQVVRDEVTVLQDEVTLLQERNSELEQQVAMLEDLVVQSTDWIVRLSDLLRANGITPPDIVIRPGQESPP